MRVTVYSFLVFFLLFFLGCGNQAARNRNAQIVENYNKSLNQNTNTGNSENSNTGETIYSNAEAALKAGDGFIDSNETLKAIEAYEQAIEMDPDLGLAYLGLGVAYALKEKEDQFKPQTEESLKRKKKRSVEALEDAVKVFKKNIDEDSKDDTAYFNLGRAYTKLLKDTESHKAFQRAVKLNPDDGEYHTELGAAAIKLARYSEAIKALNKALEIDDENFRAEDLLEKAKEGRRRVGFRSKPKNKKKPDASDNATAGEVKDQKKPAQKPSSKQ